MDHGRNAKYPTVSAATIDPAQALRPYKQVVSSTVLPALESRGGEEDFQSRDRFRLGLLGRFGGSTECCRMTPKR
jgi:hypothetical protein